MKRIILASESPRRKELLSKITDKFEIIVSGVDENNFEFTDVSDYVMKCALLKGNYIFNKVNDINCVVISADSVVFSEDKILQKPIDKVDAFNMIKCILGKKVRILTGYAVIFNNKIYNDVSELDAEFDIISDEEIIEYIDTKEPLDKAGAFAIQGIAMKFIKNISGDFSGSIGLPVNKIYNILKENKCL